MCYGLKISWQQGFRHVSCETNSLEVLRLINGGGGLTYLYEPVVLEIRDLLCKDWTVSLTHVRHEASACANLLAKKGSSGTTSFVIMDDPPAELVTQLREDYQGTFFLRA